MNGLNFAIRHTPTHSYDMNLANKIDQAMRCFKPKLTQTSLAKLSGVPQATISRTLKGKTVPEFETLSKLVKVLKIEIDGFDLATGEQINPSKRPPSEFTAQELRFIDAYRKQPSEEIRLKALDILSIGVNATAKGKGRIPTQKEKKAA